MAAEYQVVLQNDAILSTKQGKPVSIPYLFGTSKKREKDNEVVVESVIPAKKSKAKKRSEEELKEEQRLVTLNVCVSSKFNRRETT